MDLTGNGFRTVAEEHSERGHVLLRRREPDGHLELRVNGVVVMDSAETSTERQLATAALEQLAPRPGGWYVVVGGLGLGFTLREVLADPRVERVMVAEIEPALVRWHRQGLVPHTADITADPRVQMEVADVRDVVTALPPQSTDLVLLDVDNGPGFLVYDDNAEVYEVDFLRRCREALRPGGLTAVWSAEVAPRLAVALAEVFGGREEHVLPVRLGSRESTYHLLIGRTSG